LERKENHPLPSMLLSISIKGRRKKKKGGKRKRAQQKREKRGRGACTLITFSLYAFDHTREGKGKKKDSSPPTIVFARDREGGGKKGKRKEKELLEGRKPRRLASLSQLFHSSGPGLRKGKKRVRLLKRRKKKKKNPPPPPPPPSRGEEKKRTPGGNNPLHQFYHPLFQFSITTIWKRRRGRRERVL